MPSTPQERLPASAVLYRAYKNMPQSWQELIDGMFLQYRTVNNWKNDEGGIDPVDAAHDWQQLTARFYLSEICQAIADCIQQVSEDEPEDMPDSIFAIYQALNSYNATYGQNPTLASGVPSDNDAIFTDCNDAVLFGAATQFVKYMNTVAVDMLERLDAASQSTAGLLAEIGESAPDLLDWDFLSDFIEWATETLLANYNAAYTTLVENEFRCSLYCWWKDRDCTPTIDNIREWINNETSIAISPGDQPDVVWQAMVNVTSGKALVGLVWQSILAASWVGNIWWSIPSRRLLKQSLAAMTNDPDSDYQTICGDCPELPWISFGNSPDIAYTGIVGEVNGTIGNPAPGWISTYNNPALGYQFECSIEFEAPSDEASYNQVTVDFGRYQTGALSNLWIQAWVNDPQDYAVYNAGSVPNGTFTTYSLPVNYVPGDTIKIRASFGTVAGVTGWVAIDNIRFNV